jgi:hypothetical protein
MRPAPRQAPKVKYTACNGSSRCREQGQRGASAQGQRQSTIKRISNGNWQKQIARTTIEVPFSKTLGNDHGPRQDLNLAGRELTGMNATRTSQACPNCGKARESLLAMPWRHTPDRDTAAQRLILARAEPFCRRLGPCVAETIPRLEPWGMSKDRPQR